MLTSHPTRRLRRRVAASLLVLGTATGAMVLPAGAVPQPVSSSLEGSLTTAASTFPLTGAIFEGTWDPDTGAIEGSFLFPAVDVIVTEPTPATIGLQVQQPVAGSGTVDLVTNEVTFSADLVLALLTIDSQGSGALNVAPCNYSMPVTLTGTYDPVTGFVDLSDDPFSLSVIPVAGGDTNRCVWDGVGISIASVIDPEIVGDANALDVTFDLGATDAEPPPPPPPPDEPKPPAAPPAVAGVTAAAPAAVAPNFAG